MSNKIILKEELKINQLKELLIRIWQVIKINQIIKFQIMVLSNNNKINQA
jgi:hypothetical protein